MGDIKDVLKITLIKIFLAGCLFVLIGQVILGTYLLTAQDVCGVHHRTILSVLKKHVSTDGKVPQNLSDLGSFGQNQHDLKYYPDAWNKPGRILLRSSVLNSYVITFGDGSIAMLTYWESRSSEKQPVESSLSEEERFLPVRGYILNFISVPILTLFLLITIIVERKMTKKSKLPNS